MSFSALLSTAGHKKLSQKKAGRNVVRLYSIVLLAMLQGVTRKLNTSTVLATHSREFRGVESVKSPGCKTETFVNCK